MDLQRYLDNLHTVFTAGGREESFYPALKDYLESKGVSVLILPAKTSAGFPDMKISQRDGFIVGYIEAKKPEEDLDSLIETDQIQRYRKHFKNFIFTNFLEFIHFLNGKEVGRVKLMDLEDFRAKNFSKARSKELEDLVSDFLNYQERPIKTSRELAKALSWRVALLQREIHSELSANPSLQDLYNLIKNHIIHNISEEEFADTISQALAYALLILRVKREFIRKEEIVSHIPSSLSIIRDIFIEVLKIQDKEIEWIISEIENTLNLFEPSGEELTPEELTTHFYEPFLKEYNPSLREIRGVYYTPKAVVKFIVKSVEEVLERYFSFNGYMEEDLKLLDPAGGTLTFVLEVLYRLKDRVVETFGEGTLKEYFDKGVLENFFAFELLPAPYVIGHLKVGKFLSDLGIENRKFRFYLTNTLEFEHQGIPYLFSQEWAREVQEADEIKTRERILVVLGNPPYSGISANNQREINEFLKRDIDGCQSYYKVDGRPLEEKNPKWLQDDYVKFIRFAQWKIQNGGKGVVGYITNHSYIDNPTFRGMRQSLLKTFDRIYILDLHGNKRKREPDENVFDIQQGVAIGIFIKDGSKEGENAEVYYHSTLTDQSLTTREEKLSFLEDNTLQSINWHRVEPRSPFYFFKPVEIDEEYESFWSVDRIFDKYSVGVVTGRDKLTIDIDKDALKERLRDFISLNPEEARKKYNLGKDARDWKVHLAQEDLKREGLKHNRIVQILYRPFDIRFTYYTGRSRGFHCMPRPEIMTHMLKGENLGLITMNQVSLEGGYSHVYITNRMIDNRIFASSKGIAYLFPLYLYKDSERIPNFTKEFREYINQLYPEEPSPEDILHYIYAILYSPTYREKYKEQLKYNFPRIPFVPDHHKFKEISKIGEKLTRLHLLEDESLSKPTARFHGKGNNLVEKVLFKDSKVFINKDQYFEPISEEVWQYKIGGYQVLRKWLTDRKGRKLTFEEIKTYLKVIKAVEETLKCKCEYE